MKRFVFLNSKVLAMTVLAFLLLLPSLSEVQAQSLSTSGIDLSLSNPSPAPGQTITIKATSYSSDMNSSNVTWTSGGKILQKGIGLTSLSVKAPEMGKVLTVSVTAIAPDGTTVVGTVSINSGTIDFILEPQGYVPPFFKGKVPAAYQNSVKIIAVPHLSNSAGVEYDPKNLIYKWDQNGSVMQNESGYGKQSVVIAGGVIPRQDLIGVTVSIRDGGLSVGKIVTLDRRAPSVVFYDNDPLYGPLFNAALGDSVYLGSLKEKSVLAVPYGFNVPSSDSDALSYTWFINNLKHPELDSNKSITLRAPDTKGGTSNIQVTVRNAKALLQQAMANFTATWNVSDKGSASATSF